MNLDSGTRQPFDTRNYSADRSRSRSPDAWNKRRKFTRPSSTYCHIISSIHQNSYIQSGCCSISESKILPLPKWCIHLKSYLRFRKIQLLQSNRKHSTVAAVNSIIHPQNFLLVAPTRRLENAGNAFAWKTLRINEQIKRNLSAALIGSHSSSTRFSV